MEYVRKDTRQYRPFAEARAFVHTLGLKNSDEWQVYCKSDQKPQDIPSAPHYIYKNDFKGMGDWLGTGTIAPRDRHRQYRPFAEARAFVHTLGLKNNLEWREYCRSKKKPSDIPVNPDRAYGSEFQGYGDWLGTGRPGPLNFMFLPFAQARSFVHSLKLKNHLEWRTYCASGKKPSTRRQKTFGRLGLQRFALIGPLEGLGHSPVVIVNKGEYLRLQVLHRGERAAFEDLAHQNGEPDFNLVHPGTMDAACNERPPNGLGRSRMPRD